MCFKYGEVADQWGMQFNNSDWNTVEQTVNCCASSCVYDNTKLQVIHWEQAFQLWGVLCHVSAAL